MTDNKKAEQRCYCFLEKITKSEVSPEGTKKKNPTKQPQYISQLSLYFSQFIEPSW